ncbi:response regulator [Jatrophihabitans fulvus]
MNPDNAPASGLHVLIADDQADVRYALRDALAGRGGSRGGTVRPLRVSLAGSGSHAVEALEGDHVDIVVLDVRMSGGGADLVTTVRDRWPGTTIVSTSTHVGERTRMLAAGASYFAEKSQVVELVRSVMVGSAG